MPIVGGHNVPATEQEAKARGWHPMGAMIESVPPPGPKYRADCQKIAVGALCDAYIGTGGKVIATYCDGNKLCNDSYREP